eukprot:CAMPEP_0204826450 /NCGR_PEP_ID=MMETSP1346-20131115/4139_1 /ASSEMBLY_ACC=CAM_ASM_000771 /TAXON_ID=215587 /ORGANISM="Aplanochytrium stocchinoi, Strain GSBS06" /LENGTH=440 /DNA_ID=CAMNT_0051954483 /DNA_START=335 /DNA_END=1657 /DNA_ORIENTATION=-
MGRFRLLKNSSQIINPATTIEHDRQLNLPCTECGNRSGAPNVATIRCSIKCGNSFHYPSCAGHVSNSVLLCKPCSVIVAFSMAAPAMFQTNDNICHSYPQFSLQPGAHTNTNAEKSSSSSKSTSTYIHDLTNSDNHAIDEASLVKAIVDESGPSEQSKKDDSMLEAEREKNKGLKEICRKLTLKIQTSNVDIVNMRKKIKDLESLCNSYRAIITSKGLNSDKMSMYRGQIQSLKLENQRLRKQVENLNVNQRERQLVFQKKLAQWKEGLLDSLLHDLDKERKNILDYAHGEMKKGIDALNAAVAVEEDKTSDSFENDAVATSAEGETNGDARVETTVKRVTKRQKVSVDSNVTSCKASSSKEIEFRTIQHETNSNLYIAIIGTDEWTEYLGVFEREKLNLAREIAMQRKLELFSKGENTNNTTMPYLTQKPKEYFMGRMI